jgi:hypothetical protein
MNPADIPVWFQAGGLLAFAAAVWLDLRHMRKALESQGQDIAVIRDKVGAKPKRRAPTNPADGDRDHE